MLPVNIRSAVLHVFTVHVNLRVVGSTAAYRAREFTSRRVDSCLLCT